MKEQEVIRRVMKEKQMTQTDVAVACGKKNQSYISMLLQGKSMRVDNLVKVLNACGYDLVAVDRGGIGRKFTVTEEPTEEDDLAENGETLEDRIRSMIEKMVDEKIGERSGR